MRKAAAATALTLLSVVGSVFKTAHAATTEEIEALCNVLGDSCSYCQDPCTSYRFFDGTYYYSSGCGEYCKTQRGSITMLDLQSKRLTTLSSDIGKLTNLEYLDLSKNSLTTLPNSLKSLKNLTKLYIIIYNYFKLFI